MRRTVGQFLLLMLLAPPVQAQSVPSAEAAPKAVEPALNPVRTLILPGEPILLRLGVRNGGARSIDWPFTQDGTPEFRDSLLEWSVDEVSWKPCETLPRSALVESKARSIPAGGVAWATGDFVQAERLCVGVTDAKQASFRLRIGTGTHQQMSEWVRIQIKHGGDAGIVGPESWGWGYTQVRLLGSRQCAVWLPWLDWKASPAPSQRHSRQVAADVDRYLQRYPEFPFRDCLQLSRASALAGGGETSRAREAFIALRSSTKDAYIKEQCSIALGSKELGK